MILVQFCANINLKIWIHCVVDEKSVTDAALQDKADVSRTDEIFAHLAIAIARAPPPWYEASEMGQRPNQPISNSNQLSQHIWMGALGWLSPIWALFATEANFNTFTH